MKEPASAVIGDGVRSRREAGAVLAFGALSVLHGAPATVAFVDPEAFVRLVADYGAGADHYIRDLGVGGMTAAAGATAAIARRSWRPCVIALLLVYLVLHAVSHLVDRADGSGGANTGVAVSMALQAVFLAVAARASRTP